VHCTDMKSPTRRAGLRWLALGTLICLAAGCGSTLPMVPTAAGSPSKLPPPAASKNWADFKVQAARRIVEANPDGVYTGPPQQVLLAIPVLEIELNADGSIKRIDVMRRPGQAPETLQMAIDAVKRAAPFGDVSRLPKPWKFAEVFLFNDDRRFKPRTLDAL
jgi:hypothetical protein